MKHPGDLVRRADHHRRTKIAGNPLHSLDRSDTQPTPLLQQDRRARHQQLVAEAVAHDLATPEPVEAGNVNTVEIG